ncbi:hypothetical protein AAFC00_006077 [Neodothiora populina]|uniref:Major facilitator superfamily (MFS) profile domain-containing protein n=1 Tax=Neodothiora populina TaxID=2781224 RepID=A0ABR3P7L8_9PEZI
MQSLRQYKELHEFVKAYHNGKARLDQTPRSLEDTLSLSDSFAGSVDEKTESKLVDWNGPDDKCNPRNWSRTRRWGVLFLLWINVFALDWAGSADSQASSKISAQFHVSEEAETLSPALYNFGIGFGALFAGPISETVGSNPIYIGSRFFQLCWLIGVALSPNFGAKCVFRFLAGIGGSILLAIHAASVADLFSIVERTVAWPVIVLASFYGPALSPLVGAWIAQSNVSWRWTEWIPVIISGFTLLFTVFLLPETFAPILLQWKAKHLRAVTGDERYLSEIERQASVAQRLKAALLRSLHMLTKEPIVPLLGFWLVLVYVVVYGFLQGYSFIFGDTYGFKRGLIGTSYAAILTGVTLWTCSVPVYVHLYNRKVIQLERENGDEVPLAILLPISLFWLGWTNYASISPWSDLGAVTLFSVCWAGIYVAVYQYILDVYGIYAGSALAIVTFFRYWSSALINLVARPWYSNLGVHWVMTIIGCLAVLLAPAPFFLFRYGPAIRKKSRFASRYARLENERKKIGRATRWT